MIDEENFRRLRAEPERQDRESLEALEEGQHKAALLDRSERQFLDHGTMTSDLAVTKERNQ